MELFENGVGRPTNEIKKKRRNFVFAVIAAVVVVAGLTTSILTSNVNSKKLKGVPIYSAVVSYSKKNSASTTSINLSSYPNLKKIELYNLKKLKSVKTSYTYSLLSLNLTTLPKLSYSDIISLVSMQKYKSYLTCPTSVRAKATFVCKSKLYGNGVAMYFNYADGTKSKSASVKSRKKVAYNNTTKKGYIIVRLRVDFPGTDISKSDYRGEDEAIYITRVVKVK